MSANPRDRSSRREPAKGAPTGPAGEGGRRATRWPLAAAALLLVVLAGLYALSLMGPRPGPAPVSSSGAALIGGPFHLVDVDGRPADQHVLDGKWSAVFFGYTNCPDTCPATLAALNAATQRLSQP